MKKLGIVLALTIVLAGGAIGSLSSLSQAQVFVPPPSRAVVAPWVGPNTPWVFYNGDWFSKGILHYYFGPQYGWAPYYAYPRACMVRPAHWYAPRWNTWYEAHPAYRQHFHHDYPYWRAHQVGHHYDEAFYHRHHHGQGGDWHG